MLYRRARLISRCHLSYAERKLWCKGDSLYIYLVPATRADLASHRNDMSTPAFATNIFGVGLRRASTSNRNAARRNICSNTRMGVSLTDIDGKSVDLGGKVVFVMNVASACGYTTAGYNLLKDLTTKYKPDKFAAVAIPCNAFGSQESGSDAEIKAFASERVSNLVLAQKSSVKGADAHPLVKKAQEKFPDKISWNFDGRYVFDSNGTPVARFNNSSSDGEIMAEIEKHL